MTHSSTIQVLKVTNETLKSKEGKEYFKRQAEVMLLDDAGNIEVVGALRLTEALAKDLTPGVYRAGFSMVRVEYGDRKGDITSQLVSLMPVNLRASTPATSPAPKVAA